MAERKKTGRNTMWVGHGHEHAYGPRIGAGMEAVRKTETEGGTRVKKKPAEGRTRATESKKRKP